MSFAFQLVVNGCIVGAEIAIVAIGFSLVYSTARFFHFAHGIIVAVGAYTLYTLHVAIGFPLWLACGGGILGAVICGCLVEISIYRPLRRRESSPLVLFLASMGIYVVLQNLLSLGFGDAARTVRGADIGHVIDIQGVRITTTQVLIVMIAATTAVCATAFLRWTKTGRAIRAVSNNPELATVCGVRTDTVILAVLAMGSLLAGGGGVLIALDLDITPNMGMNVLMVGTIATIIGGVGSVGGAALGALLLGVIQHLGVWKVNTQWQEALAFSVLVVFLLFRPRGLLGRPEKKT